MSIIIGANLIILSRRSKHYSLFLSVPHKKHMEQMLINSKVTFLAPSTLLKQSKTSGSINKVGHNHFC